MKIVLDFEAYCKCNITKLKGISFTRTKGHELELNTGAFNDFHSNVYVKLFRTFVLHIQFSFNSHCEIISQIPAWEYK